MPKTVFAFITLSLVGSAALAQYTPQPNYPQPNYPNQQYPQPAPQPYPGYPNQQYPNQQYPNQQYPQQGDPEQNRAIDLCTQAVLQQAEHFGRPQMGPIRAIDRTRGGFRLSGSVFVEQRGVNRDRRDGDWHDGDRRDGDRRDGDHRDFAPVTHQGSYSCEVRYGRVTKLKVRDLGDPARY